MSSDNRFVDSGISFLEYVHIKKKKPAKPSKPKVKPTDHKPKSVIATILEHE